MHGLTEVCMYSIAGENGSTPLPFASPFHAFAEAVIYYRLRDKGELERCIRGCFAELSYTRVVSPKS